MPSPPFRPTPRYPLPDQPPLPGGPLGNIPYLFPQIERPLPFGHGQVPPHLFPPNPKTGYTGGTVPPYSMYTYPSGGVLPGGGQISPAPWMDQFSQDLMDRNAKLSKATKVKLYDLYKARNLSLPGGVPLPSKVKAFLSSSKAKQVEEAITARETARGIGNLWGGMQVGANMGVDMLNDYMNRVFNPNPPPGSSPGGTAVFPGAMDPAAVLNLGAQHLMGGDIGILPGVTIPGRQ